MRPQKGNKNATARAPVNRTPGGPRSAWSPISAYLGGAQRPPTREPSENGRAGSDARGNKPPKKQAIEKREERLERDVSDGDALSSGRKLQNDALVARVG